MDVLTDDSRALLLLLLQRGLPLSRRPFKDLGERCGASEAEVLDAVRQWSADGLLRRLGGVFESSRLGYQTTLCAVAAPWHDVEAAAGRLAAHSGVTHCYARAPFECRHDRDASELPPLWFTLTARQEAFAAELARLRTLCRPHGLLELPACKRFKIEVIFDTGSTLTGPESRAQRSARSVLVGCPAERDFSEGEIRLIRGLQGDLALVERPYDQLATAVGYGLEDLLGVLDAWIGAGILRRIAGIFRHRELGFRANGMGVWRVDPHNVERVGVCLAEMTYVTHCYERAAVQAFPYNVYAMMHAGTWDALTARFEHAAGAAAVLDGRLLCSVHEYKKTSPVYFGS